MWITNRMITNTHMWVVNIYTTKRGGDYTTEREKPAEKPAIYAALFTGVWQ
jgi:hypothetical protein